MGLVEVHFDMGLKKLEFRWMSGCPEEQPGMLMRLRDAILRCSA